MLLITIKLLLVWSPSFVAKISLHRLIVKETLKTACLFCRGITIEENPLHRAFVQAGVDAGYPRTEDMNGYQQEGFG